MSFLSENKRGIARRSVTSVEIELCVTGIETGTVTATATATALWIEM